MWCRERVCGGVESVCGGVEREVWCGVESVCVV